jgi:hypothetical protein
LLAADCCCWAQSEKCKWEQLGCTPQAPGDAAKQKDSSSKALAASQGPRPEARYGHVALCDAQGENMVVMGGFNKQEAFADIWQFHFGTLLRLTTPAPRRTSVNKTFA